MMMVKVASQHRRSPRHDGIEIDPRQQQAEILLIMKILRVRYALDIFIIVEAPTNPRMQGDTGGVQKAIAPSV